MTNATAKQTAIIRFMSNGGVEVKLSGVDGITARSIDIASNLLVRKIDEMRAVERRKGTVELEKARQETLAEERRIKEETQAREEA